MVNFDDLIESAALPEDDVPICLDGKLFRRFEALERQLDDAQDDDLENSMAAGGRAVEIAEQIEALREEMKAHTHAFAFRALPKKKYRDLLESHPPRDDHKEDAVFGANLNSFPLALIQACCIDPVMTVQQVEDLCEVLSDGQVMSMFSCALGVNRVSVNVPKSAAAFAILGRHAPKSKPPAPGASPAGGSSAGSPAG